MEDNTFTFQLNNQAYQINIPYDITVHEARVDVTGGKTHDAACNAEGICP